MPSGRAGRSYTGAERPLPCHSQRRAALWLWRGHSAQAVVHHQHQLALHLVAGQRGKGLLSGADRVAALQLRLQSAFGEQLRTSTGLPINALSDDVLHYADFAYLIGFAVAALVYWIGWRMTGRAADESLAPG